MNLEQLLLEVHKNILDTSTILNDSKIKNCVKNLPRPLTHIDFDQCFYCGNRLAYGIYECSYSTELSESEIINSCNIFKSVFQEVFNLKAELKIELINSDYNFYEDNDGCPHRDYDYDYIFSWYVLK